MQKPDIDKLEHILTHPEKYRKQLRYRELELSDTPKELNPDGRHTNTMNSAVETQVIKRQSDVEYQLLYNIVNETARFIDECDELEQIIIDYRYRQIDITLREWEHIAALLDEHVSLNANRKKSIGKTTTLIIRDNLLERYAEVIGYPLMQT